MDRTSMELCRIREAIVRAHIDAENKHDAAAVIATFHRPQYEIIPMGAVLDGAEPVSEFLTGTFSGFPDFAAQVPSLIHCDSGVVAEGRFTGTHEREWAGIPATGRSVDVPFCAIFVFEEDRCVSERLYFDFATMLRQLGVMS